MKWKRVQYTDMNGNERIKIVSEKKGNKEGFRIVNLECLDTYVNDLTKHAMTCDKMQQVVGDPIELIGEVWFQGLASIIAARCKGCGKTIELKSPRMRADNKFEINVRAVWAQMVTGGGPSHLQEQCATMGMPSLSQIAFSNIEEEIGSWWKEVKFYTNLQFMIVPSF